MRFYYMSREKNRKVPMSAKQEPRFARVPKSIAWARAWKFFTHRSVFWKGEWVMTEVSTGCSVACRQSRSEVLRASWAKLREAGRAKLEEAVRLAKAAVKSNGKDRM